MARTLPDSVQAGEALWVVSSCPCRRRLESPLVFPSPFLDEWVPTETALWLRLNADFFGLPPVSAGAGPLHQGSVLFV